MFIIISKLYLFALLLLLLSTNMNWFTGIMAGQIAGQGTVLQQFQLQTHCRITALEREVKYLKEMVNILIPLLVTHYQLNPDGSVPVMAQIAEAPTFQPPNTAP